MDLIVQLCLVGFGAALFLYLVAQLSGGCVSALVVLRLGSWFFSLDLGVDDRRKICGGC